MEDILQPYINKSINENETNVLDKLKSKILNFPFFKNITDNFPNTWHIIFNKILNNLTFLEYLPNQIIFKKGDKINCIYIIFTGEINVFDPGLIESINKLKNLKKIDYNINKNNVIRTEKRSNIYDNIYNIYDINLIPNSNLLPGYALGESVNYFQTNVSNKIVQACKKSILGYIKYQKYKKIMNELKSLESNHLMSFIKGLNLFGNMNNFIEKLKQNLTYKKYLKGSYIFKQGDDYKTFYIIKNGNVNISMNVNKTIKSSIEQDLLIGNNNKRNFTHERKHELNGYYVEKINYNLVNFGNGEIVGDIEYYKHYTKYLYSVKCLNTVDLFEINLKMFKKLIIECGDNLSRYHEKIKQKINFFEKRIKEINNAIKRKNETIFQKDRFTKIFLDNHIYKQNKENNKFINSFSKPLGEIKIKYNSKKMLNCSCGNISHYMNKKIDQNTSGIKEDLNNCSNYKNLRFNRRKLLSSKSVNQENSFIENSKNNTQRLLSTKKKYLFRNKSICFLKNNILINNSGDLNILDNISYDIKRGTKTFREINTNKYKNPKKYYNLILKNKTPGNNFLKYISNKNISVEENEKNFYEKKIKNDFLKYLINEKNKRNYQKCQEMSKKYFIMNNNCIKSKSLKQSFFFRIKK